MWIKVPSQMVMFLFLLHLSTILLSHVGKGDISTEQTFLVGPCISSVGTEVKAQGQMITAFSFISLS